MIHTHKSGEKYRRQERERESENAHDDHDDNNNNVSSSSSSNKSMSHSKQIASVEPVSFRHSDRERVKIQPNLSLAAISNMTTKRESERATEREKEGSKIAVNHENYSIFIVFRFLSLSLSVANQSDSRIEIFPLHNHRILESHTAEQQQQRRAFANNLYR